MRNTKINIFIISLLLAISAQQTFAAFENKSQNFQKCARAISNPIWRNKGTWRPDYINFNGKNFENHYDLCTYMEGNDDLTKEFLKSQKAFIERTHEATVEVYEREAGAEITPKKEELDSLATDIEKIEKRKDTTDRILKKRIEEHRKNNPNTPLSKNKNIMRLQQRAIIINRDLAALKGKKSSLEEEINHSQNNLEQRIDNSFGESGNYHNKDALDRINADLASQNEDYNVEGQDGEDFDNSSDFSRTPGQERKPNADTDTNSLEALCKKAKEENDGGMPASVQHNGVMVSCDKPQNNPSPTNDDLKNECISNYLQPLGKVFADKFNNVLQTDKGKEELQQIYNQQGSQLQSICASDDPEILNSAPEKYKNALTTINNFQEVVEDKDDSQCKELTDEEVMACNDIDRSLVPNYNAIVQECKKNVQSNHEEEISKNLEELSTIKNKCSATTSTADANPNPNGEADPNNPCVNNNNLIAKCEGDQTVLTCTSSDKDIGNKESCSYDKNQKTVTIKVRNSQEDVKFSWNGTNLTPQNGNFAGPFNNSKQAMQYLIGYNINKKGSLRDHYNKVIKDEITEVPYPGGFTNFTQCQKAAGQDSWKELVKNNERQRKEMVESMSKAHFYDNLIRAASASCDLDITEQPGRNANICIGTLVTNDSSIINRVYSNAVSKGAECEVIARVIKENFDENKHQDSEYRDGGQTASMDGRLKCSVSNIQTIDYDECKNIVNAYNAALIGKQGLTVVQQVQTQEATFDGNQRMQEAQINAVNGIRNGTDTNNPIQRQVNGQMAAYEVQKDMINKQKSQAQTRAAIDTAAAASLVGLAQALPDKNYLVDKCENTFKSSTVLQDAREDLMTIRGQFLNAANDKETYKERDMKYYCQDKIASMDHDFIPNKLISQPVYAIAAEFGVEAAKNQLSASMLKKRAGMIDDLMERIKNMDTGGEYAGLTQQEAIMKYCEAHPASPQCAALPGGTGTTVINPGGFNLGGEDFAANGLDGYDVEDFGEDLDTVSEIDENGDGDGSTGPTSTKVADVNKNGEKGAIAPRAKIGNGGGRGPASGGGAGGAASAGNRGGGGAPEGEKGKAQGSGQAKNKSLAYNSGKNNAYLKGGGSINSRSNKKVANPFAKLFKNSKGKVLNFRGPSSIGKQSGNLFTRISKRYGNVHENNRLLKYKYTPAK